MECLGQKEPGKDERWHSWAFILNPDWLGILPRQVVWVNTLQDTWAEGSRTPGWRRLGHLCGGGSRTPEWRV